jgi:3-methyladenine DNA glycosylase AlkD
MSKYMRNKFTFMGLRAPARRALQKAFLTDNREAREDRATLLSFTRALWGQDEREFQAFAVDLLFMCRSIVLGDTELDFHEAMGLAEYFVVTKSWWDTVDPIAYQGEGEVGGWGGKGRWWGGKRGD